MKKSLIAAILALFSFIFTLLFLDFFYDYYEAYASALVTGKITPSIIFDDWFYFGYVGYIKLFVLLYQFSSNVDWYSILSYTLLITALTFYIKILKVNFSFLKAAVLLTTIVFFVEHLMLLNMNRVSFLLSFIALFYVFVGNRSFNFKKIIIGYILFTLAFLFRLEAAILSLSIIVFTGFTLGLNFNMAQLRRVALILIYPICLIVLTTVWFDIDIKNSSDFYKQIEPDVEYELMTRDNIIDISYMRTSIDSLRYQAIFDGVWGDAKTNDALFLRSLIGNNFNSLLSFNVAKRGFNVLIESSSKIGALPFVNLFLFVLVAIASLVKSRRLVFRFILYQFIFICLLLVVGGYVKMTEPALSALLFINLFTLLYYGSAQLKSSKNGIGRFVFYVLLLLATSFKLVEMKKCSNANLAVISKSKEELKLIETVAQSKNLYLSAEGVTPIFHSYQPFRPFNNQTFKGLYVFNSLAMSTIRPYKDFLDKECQCNANDYASYFPAIKEEGDLAVFLMSEETKSFYERYLKGVHQLDISFQELSREEMIVDNEYGAGMDQTKSIKFYVIEQN